MGTQYAKSLGQLELLLKTPENITPIIVMLDIVPVDVPALLGLDVLYSTSLVIDNVLNRLWNRIIISDEDEKPEFVDN